ncbi:MAG: hypothetical protein GY853_03120 [PVC group bacterium]|nr:hypothetical protein [PVC group bacterium]
MNLFTISSVLIFTFTLLIGIIAYWKGTDKKITKVWALFCLSISIWGMGGYIFSSTISKDVALLGWRITNIGVILIPVTFYHFIYLFLRLHKKSHRRILIGSYVLGSLFLVFNFLPRQFFVGDVSWVFGQFYYGDWWICKSPLYLLLYILFYWVLLLYVFTLLITQYNHFSGNKREQLKYFILAAIVGWVGPTLMWPICFRIYIYPYSNFLIAFFPFIIAYAIIKHRLMDIKIALTRGAILLIVYAFIVGVPLLFVASGRTWLTGLFNDKWFYPPLIMYTVLALLAPYIYLRLQAKAEAKRMLEQYHLHQSLKAASKTTIEVQSVKKLSKIIPRYLLRLYGRLNNKITHISLFLMDKNKKIYRLKSSVGDEKLPKDLSISENSILVDWFTKISHEVVEQGVLKAKEVEVLVYEDIDYWMNEANVLRAPYRGLKKILRDLKKTMESLNAQIILPSVYQQELLGFLILGEKTPDLYTRNDIDTFSILANDSAMAFKAARLFEDLKMTQAQLIQSEKLNLLGQLASSMAHEINNPLAIISGNIQLLLMDVKDEGIRELLKKIDEQTERGYKIIHRLLNFSKLPKEDIKDIDMHETINETLELVNHKIIHGNIMLERHFDEVKIIKGNPIQIQEVLLNLFVNAIQAMPEGGDLKIYTKQLDGFVQVVVEDNGKGIEAEDVANIFDPFYTKGKKDGTGLGLFVADQIMKLHKGSIELKSKLGEGTTFTLKFAEKL